jgi:chemotaxis protein CheZ
MVDHAGDALAERLASIRASYPGSQPDMVADVVRAVLTTMSGDLSAQETSLLAEVEELGKTIASAKAEIAALRVDDTPPRRPMPSSAVAKCWTMSRED